ncbi:OLC1v1012319C1 [Oldenlandia corymbosa var. corymbosa]|uniref:OLC1v1012319C1 n=1 Tax=Oldenlandia corymbosa var. corymbosa TaxID=529605 RepID=A0AAV1DZ16_OLDCO|nr:OLC1v1012319C1 [Oldenlandia corymbosa var. corymbosa]
MGSKALITVFLVFLPTILAQNLRSAVLSIDTTAKIAETDDNYICATIDWWPKEKCNYNQCPWGSSSLLNLDLSHPLLFNAVQAFKSLRLRLGGSLQDQVHYDIGSSQPCKPFKKQKGGLFGFSEGCLPMERWDELNGFFQKTGVLVTFGLNALRGRHQTRRGVWLGNWDSSNARDFVRYTISKGYHICSWEFGNELCGKGIGASVGAEQYAKDVTKLNSIISEESKGLHSKPLVLAPGGFYDKDWYSRLLQLSGPEKVDVLTHHIYNLGAGVDHNLISKILNPYYLNKVTSTFGNLSSTIQNDGSWSSAWVGEAGGAYNNGGRNVSDTFVNSFWYLDQLGLAAKYNTKVYCRQTLIGGNYALLDTSTFIPNPDYYSALLWHQIMGKGVLSIHSSEPYLRSYAHCSKGGGGVAVLLINLSNETAFNIEIESATHFDSLVEEKTESERNAFVRNLKKTVAWIGSKTGDENLWREEYHLTPKDGDLQSKIMLLNGEPLQLTNAGGIPSLGPVFVDLNSPMYIEPLSIKFIVLPNFNAPGC